VIFSGQTVFENNHGRHDVGSRQVRHVVALDPKRRLVHADRFLNVGQSLRPGYEVGRAAHLVQLQRVFCVDVCGLHECSFFAALSRLQLDATLSADAGKPGFQLVGVFGQFRDDHFFRNLGCGAVIGALEDAVHELAGRQIELFVDGPRTDTADASASNEELLNGRGELVVFDAEQIGIDRILENDSTFFKNSFESLQAVTIPSRSLVILSSRSFLHLFRGIRHKTAIVACHEADEVIDHGTVFFHGHLARTRTSAATDLPGEARLARLHGPLVARI
jgi:hypothetical protein